MGDHLHVQSLSQILDLLYTAHLLYGPHLHSKKQQKHLSWFDTWVSFVIHYMDAN